MKVYCEEFDDQDEARASMQRMNRAARAAGDLNDLFVVIDGPEEDTFAVVDIETAISLDTRYEWTI